MTLPTAATLDSEPSPPARKESALVRTLGETSLVVRAGISSVLATGVDGIVYQAILVLVGGYGTASAAGAVLGATTNFYINRFWAFRGTRRNLAVQWFEYLLASVVTYLVLRSSLYGLIEVVGLGEHVAWVPAKIVAWVIASYPIQRFLVFRRPRPRLEAPVLAPSGEDGAPAAS